MKTLLTSILKTIKSPDKPIFSKKNINRPAFSRNNSYKLAFEKNNSNSKIRLSGDNIKYAKKFKKSKDQKSAKSQKSSKLGKSKSEKSKKLIKSGNSSNFEAIKARSIFLTFDTRIAFNYLLLAFIKALILCHFDPECHIWIEIDVSGYDICEVLNQLTFWTNPNKVATKVDLCQWYLITFFLKKIISVET